MIFRLNIWVSQVMYVNFIETEVHYALHERLQQGINIHVIFLEKGMVILKLQAEVLHTKFLNFGEIVEQIMCNILYLRRNVVILRLVFVHLCLFDLILEDFRSSFVYDFCEAPIQFIVQLVFLENFANPHLCHHSPGRHFGEAGVVWKSCFVGLVEHFEKVLKVFF